MKTDRPIITLGTTIVIRGALVKVVGMILYWGDCKEDSDLVLECERPDGSRFTDVYYHVERVEGGP